MSSEADKKGICYNIADSECNYILQQVRLVVGGDGAYSVYFGSEADYPNLDDYRYHGYSVRLITDVK